MRWFGRAWGHDRWAGNVAAHVDGELAAGEALRFEAHLEGCSACRAAVTEEQALKRLLSGNLGQVPAPRSFAITAAMLERAGRPARGTAGAGVLAMRLAQGVAAVALIGLVSLVVVDRSTNQSGGDSTTAAPMSAESGAAESRAPEPSPVRDSGSSKAAATVVPPYSAGGVQGQSADSPIPQPTAAAPEGSGYAPVQPAGETGSNDLAIVPPGPEDGDGGTNWFRVAEGGLVLVSISALGAYLVARRANRRSSDV